uniref:ATPase inhibitor, mitochondrial n=1 Tax=Balaenoptera musculus TaxID=9771 RepID=A0A8C0HSJ8_BALMU
MAATALAARTRFGVWSVWAMQGRGFGSESADNLGSSAGAVRDAGGAFGKKEQAEEERYFRARRAVSFCFFVALCSLVW